MTEAPDLEPELVYNNIEMTDVPPLSPEEDEDEEAEMMDVDEDTEML